MYENLLKICENMRKSAKICDHLLETAANLVKSENKAAESSRKSEIFEKSVKIKVQNLRNSAEICESLRKSAEILQRRTA